MKHKTALSIFAVVYTLMFLIGPWHFYGELKGRAVRGISLEDEPTGLVGAAWDDQTFRACLKGRIDGEEGDIYLELKSKRIDRQSVRHDAAHPFKNIIALPRNQYDKGCKLFTSEEFQLEQGYFHLTDKYYHIGNVKKDLVALKNGNYILLKLSRDEGGNLYNNYFGVYQKTDTGDRLAWFELKGVIHQKFNPSAFDYFLALVKDFFTMPYQWVMMFIYASGGIG